MKDITLVAIEFQWYELTQYAIVRSLENIDAKEVVIISDREILPGAKHIICDPVANISEYANIMLKGTAEHVNTSHALYVQWDGIANDKTQWTDDFLKYDYIGAVWPGERENYNVGNGGFSLRSKKLLDACQDATVTLTPQVPVAEDRIIGYTKRDYLSSTYDIKYAPTELARQFSFEIGEHVPSFGFHGLWNVFNLMSDKDMDYFIPRIDYAKWNHFKWHHVLAALIRRNRMDLYEVAVNQLIANSPELLEPMAKWLEQDSRNPQTKLVIN
jgi:hypothetical protein